MKYLLEINEKQARIMQDALEEYFRIRMNQWSDLANDLASVGFVYDKDNPDNRKNFDSYIERRDKTKELLEKAMLEAQPERKYRAMNVEEDVLIAEDIWQVIRHQLYIDKNKNDNSYCTASRPPLPMSDEELPKISKQMK